MSHKPPHLTAILCLAILLISARGCSRISIPYNSADFLIERYVKDYLALEDPQIASWYPELQDALARHRREYLPYLARFFETAHEGAVKGLNARRMRCLIDQLEDIYRRHMGVAVDLATPLLHGLTPNQIRALADKFHEEAAEDEADMGPAGTTRRNRKRAERYQKSIEWWIGPLAREQKLIVREQIASMPDTAADWMEYRNTERNALIALLEQRSGEAKLHEFLDAWLVEHRDLPARLDRARNRMRGWISALSIRMDETFSAEQRAHFAHRLAGLRDDFMALQRHPRMAPVRCVNAG